MGSMPASRKVSRTKRWRSFSAFKATSVTAANSVFRETLAVMRSAV